MNTEKEAFEAAIEASPLDYGIRVIYADWLDEHGEHEEADRQRKFEAADKWMRSLPERLGETCTNYSELCSGFHDRVQGTEFTSPEGRAAWDAAEEWWAATEKWEYFTYEELIAIGHPFIDMNGRDWLVQLDREEARNMMNGTLLEEFWTNWETITGRKVSDELRETSPFSCSC